MRKAESVGYGDETSVSESVQFTRLSQLTQSIQSVIKESFAGIYYWVIADINSHSFQTAKNNHYFELVEKEEGGSGIIAKMRCSAWQSGALKIRKFEEVTGQQFKNDINVLVKVSVSYHSLYGLQLVLHDIDPAFTIGRLEQQKQATIQKLLTECRQYICKQDGRFVTRNNQLALQSVIQKIAVISSSNSAGLQDFIHTLENNAFTYRFRIDHYYTVVQGEANAELVCNKFIDVFHSGVSYDAVVLIRGGGSQTDFLLFDQFVLGRVVAKFPIPVITGIGHQKNETIVDLMAHSPTKTPTKAAEFIIAHNRDFEDDVLTAHNTILLKAQQCISKNMLSLSNLNLQLLTHAKSMIVLNNERLSCIHQGIAHTVKIGLCDKKAALAAVSCRITSLPANALVRRMHELNTTTMRTTLLARMALARQRCSLEQFAAMCRLMSPESILKKGFAIVYYQEKNSVSGNSIPLGAEVTIRLSDARLAATITQNNTLDGNTHL